jgi:hypothetical protein
MKLSVLSSMGTRISLSLFALLPLSVAPGCGSPGDGGVGSSSEAIVSGTTNNETAFDYFVSQGLSYDQAAGIVGNLDQESSMDPTISQYGGGPGRGIAQWSAGGRWDTDPEDNVLWYASRVGQSAESLQLQLEFVWYELTTFPSYGLEPLRAANNVTGATVAFQGDFEGCGTCDQGNRITFANEALSAFGRTVIGLDGKCLDVLGDVSTNGAPIDLYECNAGGNQLWTLESGHLEAFGKCLDVVNGGTTDGTAVQLWECNGNPQQVWTYANGMLKNPHSNKCLNVPGFDSSNGTKLIIWDCETSGNGNEIWHINSGSGATTGSVNDSCSNGSGFCTETLQCDNGHWIARTDDSTSCTSVENVSEPCSGGDGYCTTTLQCDGGYWVPRTSDSAACTSGPGG